jgi:uncharacterized protein (TIGR00299 family) protein
MNILYYDCFAGISGDMNLAAMLDLGVDKNFLCAELEKLGLNDEFHLHVKPDAKSGIHGTRVDVNVHHHHDHHGHGDDHNHVHSKKQHHHAHRTEEHHHHAHRNLSDITKIIDGSALSEKVRNTALDIFQRIAEAESRIHNCPLDEIHFHEVGATDAIVDVVGAAICLEALGIDQVWCSTIELGRGFVECAHGTMPVPAPATEDILKNIPTRRGGVNHEATTPTGAAILAAIVDRFTDTPEFILKKSAYGIGHRDAEKPNILRVLLAERSSVPNSEPACMLECSVDDMTAEALGYAMNRLLEAGADDVNFIPATMKKSRPATIVSVLCKPEIKEKLKQVIFQETTTLGIKSTSITKTVLDRRTSSRETIFGRISVKEALLDGKVIRTKPEFDECAAIAHRKNVPLADVYRQLPRD